MFYFQGGFSSNSKDAPGDAKADGMAATLSSRSAAEAARSPGTSEAAEALRAASKVEVLESSPSPTASPCPPSEGKSKTPRLKKELRSQKSTVARANELDYLGLDPGLVERGELRSYQETFPNFLDIFTWSQSADAALKERCLREALQLFTQSFGFSGDLGVFLKALVQRDGLDDFLLGFWQIQGSATSSDLWKINSPRSYLRSMQHPVPLIRPSVCHGSQGFEAFAVLDIGEIFQ